MKGAWMNFAIMVVFLVVINVQASEGRIIKSSLDGLLQADEIFKQLELIEDLMKKVEKKSCTSLKKKEGEEGSDKTGSESTSDEKEETTESEVEEETEEMTQCDYAKMNKNHTMVLPANTDCKVHKTGITDEERDLILSLHNELRAKVAQGNETQGDPGPQPPAAIMYQLVWNDELAKVAQAWAAQCPSYHDKERNRRLCSKKYMTGQNINYYWGVLDEGPQWQLAIDNWYNEVADTAAEVAANFQPHKTKKIGHYTQLVWGTTKEIGCGIVYYETERNGITYTHSITHVCNYGPAGNIRERPIYKQGPAASSCPGEVSEEYPKLCL